LRGHSDSAGSDEDNYRLARERADVVLGYFMEKHPSIGRDRITVLGFGSDMEFNDGKTARRVEIIVLD
jgi:outer membrane protein OmpA-like peptidoglycan-associated protein